MGSLHAHDYVMLALVAAGAAFLMRFLSRATADRKSKINIEDLFLDDTTMRMSWTKTVGLVSIIFAGIVLMQQALAGKVIDTTFGLFIGATVGPMVARIVKGGDPIAQKSPPQPLDKPPGP